MDSVFSDEEIKQPILQRNSDDASKSSSKSSLQEHRKTPLIQPPITHKMNTNHNDIDSGIDSGAPPRNNQNNLQIRPNARKRPASTSHSFEATAVTKELSSLQIGLIIMCLCLFNLVNYMDRFTIIAISDTYLKPQFGLDEKSIGLISSIFIVSYMCMSPVAGYLGDRYNRKWLIVIGAVIWMSCVFFGSMIDGNDKTSWYKLLGTRVLFGVGEACYICVAPAIIHDLFIDDTKRTNYLILFNMMVPVGSGLGYVVGGWAAEYFGSWNWALRITMPLGIISLVLFIVLTRPVPQAYAEIMASANNESKDDLLKTKQKGMGKTLKKRSTKETLRDFTKNRTFVYSTIGFTTICFVLGSGTTWLPILFSRAKLIHGMKVDYVSDSTSFTSFEPCSHYLDYGISKEKVKLLGKNCTEANWQENAAEKYSNRKVQGEMMPCKGSMPGQIDCYCECKDQEQKLSSSTFMLFGALATASGIAGAILGGKLSDKWKKSGNPRAESDICAIGLLFGSILLYISIVIVGNDNLRILNWAIYWLGLTCINFNWALVSKIVLSIVEPNEKSMANAVLNTIGHLFGDASSSVLIGMLADYVGGIFRQNITKQQVGGDDRVNNEWFEFLQIQQAMLLLPLICAFGCMAFFTASMHIQSDTKTLKNLDLVAVEVIDSSDSGNDTPVDAMSESENKTFPSETQ